MVISISEVTKILKLIHLENKMSNQCIWFRQINSWKCSPFCGTGVWTQGFSVWAMPPVYFALVILEIGVFRTICPGWPRTWIILKDSQIARCTGVSQCLAEIHSFIFKRFWKSFPGISQSSETLQLLLLLFFFNLWVC
jgi:hypothetical protein